MTQLRPSHSYHRLLLCVHWPPIPGAPFGSQSHNLSLLWHEFHQQAVQLSPFPVRGLKTHVCIVLCVCGIPQASSSAPWTVMSQASEESWPTFSSVSSDPWNVEQPQAIWEWCNELSWQVGLDAKKISLFRSIVDMHLLEDVQQVQMHEMITVLQLSAVWRRVHRGKEVITSR